MKYIGIRGHRGSGKKSISYLLGNTIEYIINNKDKGLSDVYYNTSYNTWVDQIMSDEDVIYQSNLSQVYFDSFGDTLKLFVNMLTGIDSDLIYNGYYKDHTVVNMKDFTYQVYEEIPADIKLMTKEELYNSIKKDSKPLAFTKNTYIILREFILYFGQEVMQRFFGLNVWVKSLKANKNSMWNYDDINQYKIFTDIKTPSEVTYILDNQGCIVNLSRPSNHKKAKFDKLSKDGRVDYTIYIGGDLYELKNQIFEIAKQIIEKNGKN